MWEVCRRAMGKRIVSFRWIKWCVLTVGVSMMLGIGSVCCERGRLRWLRVRVVRTVSYAEAVKKVEEEGSRVRDPERIPVNSRSVPEQKDRPTSDISFSKLGFLVFIAVVINCTAEMEHESQRIDVVVAAAEDVSGYMRFDFGRDTEFVVLSPQAAGMVPEQIGSK